MTAPLQQTARVFNATPICASKETGRLRVSDQDKLDKETAATASLSDRPQGLRLAVILQVMVRALNVAPMTASKFKETGPPLAQVSAISKLAPRGRIRGWT